MARIIWMLSVHHFEPGKWHMTFISKPIGRHYIVMQDKHTSDNWRLTLHGLWIYSQSVQPSTWIPSELIHGFDPAAVLMLEKGSFQPNNYGGVRISTSTMWPPTPSSCMCPTPSPSLFLRVDRTHVTDLGNSWERRGSDLLKTMLNPAHAQLLMGASMLSNTSIIIPSKIHNRWETTCSFCSVPPLHWITSFKYGHIS